MLPFPHLLKGRDFSVIIRTFGSDGPEVAEAINAWAEGKHPLTAKAPSPYEFSVAAERDIWR